MKRDFKAILQERTRVRCAFVGVTQLEIGKALEVSQSTASRLINGQQPAESKHLLQLADLLRTSCDYLLGGTDDPTPPAPDRHRLPRARVESALQKISSASEDLRQALAASEEAPTASATPIDSARLGARPSPARYLFDESLEDDGATSRRRSTDEGNGSTL